MGEAFVNHNQQHFGTIAALEGDNTREQAWLLPDGVSDLLHTEALKQETLRYQLTQILLSHGYQLVSPPFIEYTESLLHNASEDLKRQTFRLIDQLTGRLMGLRADITPQIARIDAYLHNNHAKTDGKTANAVARYCYAGHVVYTLPKGLFGSRTPLQLGAEIFGAADLTADQALFDVLHALLASTQLVSQCHIDIGHVAIFRALVKQADLSATQQDELSKLYANKALPELATFCQNLGVQGGQAAQLAQDFYTLVQDGNDLARLQANLSPIAQQNADIAQALADLQALVAYLRQTWQTATVSVDVSELQGYHYHTGVVFQVYVGNDALPLVRGGRFVNPHSVHTRPATGFSADLTRWQNHVTAIPADLIVVPFATWQAHRQDDSLQAAIAKLRADGQAVVVAVNEHDMPTASHELRWQDGDWQAVAR